ncbi:single-stranded DNA-binding protein [Exiguobacterium sp. NG55]|uniref:single-stranded DNA-binding protein n=1 Tax=Exiguobacterium sp. NG55 TaxID=375477 RepID=UPI0004DF7032|nr:single-stranded DNA-binding protein [Exiguobacterium sp. NG55]
MINRVVLVGRLTRDPEMRYTQSGIAVTRFTLACDRPFSGQDGKREADFIDCVVWRKQAENVAQYLKKGSMAGVDGRLQISSYEGQDGQKRYRAEVVADSVRFLSSKGDAGRDSAPPPKDDEAPPAKGGFDQQPYSGGIDLSDDDLPF